MKIFQVNDKFFVEGGSEIYIRQISTALQDLGHKVVIIYGSGPSPKEIEKEGFTAYRIPELEKEFPKDREKVLKEINRVVTIENPDVIQINNIQNGYFINEFMQLAPSLRHIHDHRLYCPGFSKTWYNSNQVCPIPFSVSCLINAYKEHCATNKPVKLLRKYQAKFYELEINRKLPSILLASEYMASQLKINDFDLKKVTVLPHPVTIPKKITAPKNNRQLLFVGRVTIEKGPQYAIEAMQEINGTLTVVGGGPQMTEYKKLAADLGVKGKVKFAGEINREKLPKYYNEADLLIFPSIWPEPHGKTGPEAFSFARPVVGFDVGGVNEWLKDGFNGFLVTRLDTKNLAEKVNYLFDHQEQLKKMGLNGREFVEKNMNEKNYLKNLTKIYQDTLHTWQKEKVLV